MCVAVGFCHQNRTHKLNNSNKYDESFHISINTVNTQIKLINFLKQKYIISISR